MENMEYMTCSNARVGYGWVPIQKFGSVYNYEDALKNGTLFPELHLPLGVYGKKAFGGKMYGRD